jgi:hypothetical protein
MAALVRKRHEQTRESWDFIEVFITMCVQLVSCLVGWFCTSSTLRPWSWSWSYAKPEPARIIYNHKITRHSHREANSLNNPHRCGNLKSYFTEFCGKTTLQPRRWREHVCPERWYQKTSPVHVITRNGITNIQPVTSSLWICYQIRMWTCRHWQGTGK